MPPKSQIFPVLTALFMTTPVHAVPEHNILNQDGYILVQTRAHAEAIAEAHITNVYGKDHAIQQKPYQVHETQSTWEVSGSLKPNRLGGVFLIVINKQNGAVLRLTHGR